MMIRAGLVLRRLPAQQAQVGLLGIFSQPFEQTADVTISKCETLAKEMLSCPPGPAVISKIDDISNELCRITDSLELIRNIHPSPEIMQDAIACHKRLSEFMFQLNTRLELYEALSSALSVVSPEHSTPAHLYVTPEVHRMGSLLAREFEMSGIHLSPEQKTRVQKLLSDELTLATQFTQNVGDDTYTCELPANRVDALPSNLQDLIRRTFSATAYSPDTHYTLSTDGSPYGSDSNGGRVVVKADDTTFHTIMQYVPDPVIRYHMYNGYYNVVRDNQNVLPNLLHTRSQIANLMGSSCYSKLALRLTMAQNPEKVANFLDQVRSTTNSRAKDEIALVQNVKKQIEQSKANEIYPWDVQYYHKLVQLNTRPIHSGDVNGYFSVSNTLQALNVIVTSLFGVEMVEVNSRRPRDIWHHSVLKLAFVNCSTVPSPRPLKLRTIDESEYEGIAVPSNDDFVGTCYLDLFARENKYANAAHFTVQCGRRPVHGSRQHPIVALVFNFASATSLTFQEVELLFHEFGHALHSLLSTTETQHLSGTRGALDLMETPSHLFEYMVRDTRIMQLYGRHRTTGQPIPIELCRDILSQRHMFRGLTAQSQVFMSSVDLELHSATGDTPIDSNFVRNVVHQQQAKGLVTPSNASWASRFGHFAWYASGYYSYLWSDVIASNIWGKHLQANPLERESGMKIRDELLKYGASRDPHALVAATLGGDASLDVWAKENSF
eukprot:c8085_g1_i1.p1 GENE.c8085_g1_i1~~c8085_g1_i1.p1  ORF type:complete len:722 (-),score=151.51 c8085_g1_i1:21-2186(-)